MATIASTTSPTTSNVEEDCPVIVDGDTYVAKCPFCSLYFCVNKNEVNCKVFIHGVYTTNGEPVNPHLSAELCDQLVKEGRVYGCCKQFVFNPATGCSTSATRL